MAVTQYLVSCRLYDEGHGEPIKQIHGFSSIYPLEKLTEKGQGRGQADSLGRSPFVTIPGIGLIQRPIPVAKDTRKVHWDTAGFAYFNWRPDVRERVTWLGFSSNEPGLEPEAIWNYVPPENPHFSFRVVIPPSSGDWNFTALPPFFRFEFGADTNTTAKRAIILNREGAYLAVHAGGDEWIAIDQITLSNSSGYGHLNEYEFEVICADGHIAVTGDYGVNWAVDKPIEPDRPITIPAAPFKIRHRGGHIYFNLGSVEPLGNAVYYSPRRNAGATRPLASPTITGEGDDSAGSITLEDDSSHPQGIAGWKATFVAGNSITSFPFQFKKLPSLGLVTYELPVVAGSLGSDYTTPWDDRIYYCHVRKPINLAESSATVRFRLPLGHTFFDEGYRFRRVDIYMGKRELDPETGLTSGEEWTKVFVGYIVRLNIADTALYTDVTAELWNASTRFRTTEWTPFDGKRLGGMTAGNAADWILASEGWDASKRSWEAIAAAQVLPKGSYTRPFLQLKRQTKKWTDLERIWSYTDRQLAVDDNGILTSLPRHWTSGVTHEYRAQDAASLGQLIESADISLDYTESITAVLSTGENLNGEELYAYLVDQPAETSVLSGRFINWRIYSQIEVDGACNLQVLMKNALYRGREGFPLKVESPLRLPVNLDVGRTDELECYGLENRGIPDGATCRVETLNHLYSVNLTTGEAEGRTTAGVRRV